MSVGGGREGQHRIDDRSHPARRDERPGHLAQRLGDRRLVALRQRPQPLAVDSAKVVLFDPKTEARID